MRMQHVQNMQGQSPARVRDGQDPLKSISLRDCAARYGTQVCNHPDLFEGRPIVSAFDMAPGAIAAHLPSLALRALEPGMWRSHDLDRLLLLPATRAGMAAWEAQAVQVTAGRCMRL
jgi:hypothetical protein